MTDRATLDVLDPEGSAEGLADASAAGAGAAYEHFVPQATREKIDEGIKDTWDATGGKVVDGVGDAWNSVFG